MPVIDVNENRKLIYTSNAMQQVVDDVHMFAPTDYPILITGSNGTGKDNIARLTHTNSQRKDHPFVALNCAAISPGLIESELFGHEKGAFTGASARHIGAFERANGGTLFLDEIGEMPAEMQTKLLRVLQDGEFRRVGGNETHIATPRIIAATNRDPEKAIKEGKLREDLYYRLRGMHISVPDLKERPDDIPMLAQHFIEKAVQKYNLKKPALEHEALDELLAYSWPGNIRELENRMGEATFRAQKDGVITAPMLRLPGKVKDKSASYVPMDDSFGFKVATLREEKHWTQQKLAEKVNEHNAKQFKRAIDQRLPELPPAYTEADVQNWESNTIMPDNDVINTLAYLLIFHNHELNEAQKQVALVEFYDAAEKCRSAPRMASAAEENLFGGIITQLREKQGLTQEELATNMSQLTGDIRLSWRDIYQIENNHPSRKLSSKETLALVKALDQDDSPLTIQDKIELYERARPSFSRIYSQVNGNGNGNGAHHEANGNGNGHAISTPVRVDAQLQEQRNKLVAFFTDKEGFQLSTAIISHETGLRPQVSASLMGRSKINPFNVAHALEDTTMNKLAEYLRALNKDEETILKFKDEFAAMRTLAVQHRQGAAELPVFH